MFLHQHFCVHYPFIFFIQTFYIRTIHYIIINLFQKFCPVCTPGDGSFFGIAPKEYDSFVEQVCLDFSHFASHACSTQDTHFRSGCLAICINDHKVPVIFGRLFALLVCTQIIVNTSLDFYILILYVKSIILYSFVERDNTLAVALDLEHCPFSSTFPLEERTRKKILYISVFTGNATEMFLDTRPQQVFRAFKGF